MSKFNKERDDLNNQLNKMPARPRKMEQIVLKNEIEEKIEKINSELAKLRMQMKSIKNT